MKIRIRVRLEPLDICVIANRNIAVSDVHDEVVLNHRADLAALGIDVIRRDVVDVVATNDHALVVDVVDAFGVSEVAYAKWHLEMAQKEIRHISTTRKRVHAGNSLVGTANEPREFTCWSCVLVSRSNLLRGRLLRQT